MPRCPAACVPAALTSSAQPGGLAVTVSCSKSDGTAFSAGSYTVYLTAGYAGDSSGTCISSSRTAFATVVTPGLTLRAPGSLPSACSGSGSVSISFPYTTSQASSAQLTAVATPSAPSVTCAAQVKTGEACFACLLACLWEQVLVLRVHAFRVKHTTNMLWCHWIRCCSQMPWPSPAPAPSRAVSCQ